MDRRPILNHHHGGNDDDDGLWDELYHQQTREMEQHLASRAPVRRPATAAGAFPTSAVTLARQALTQTTQEVGRVGNLFYTAAVEAYQEEEEARRRHLQHEHRRHAYHHSPDAAALLDDFGIPMEEPHAGHHPQYVSLSQEAAALRNGNRDNNDENADFVFLPQLRFRPQRDGWGAVANLDLYLQSLYSYYYNRGLVPIVAKGLVQVVALTVTLVLSIWLFAYLDWKALSNCLDESTCRPNLQDYSLEKPFRRASLWNLMVLVYILIFLAYGAFFVTSFFHSVQAALEAKWVFEERLGISARKLLGGAVDWDRDVVTKLAELQRTGVYRIAIHSDQTQLDALQVAHRILRKENFLVALFNRNLLDLRVPLLGHGIYFCPSLEWSLYFCILNFMFNHKYQIRPAFYLDPSALRRRFVLCGIVHAVFMPFLLFFVTFYFGLQNAYDWKSTKQYLGPREWSMQAKWLFREFNELPHQFERRLAPSYEAAEEYLGLFGSSEIMATLGRILVFIGGALGAILAAFAAMNDAILFHVKIADFNLVWYAGVVTVVYSVGKAMLPREMSVRYTRNLFYEMDQALLKVAEHTHYYPAIWKGRGSDQATHKAVSTLFQFKAQLFLIEVVSLLVAPYVLCVSLAGSAEAICEAVLALRAHVPGAGDVCGYATFDFEKYGDERWEGQTMGRGGVQQQEYAPGAAASLSESILRASSVEEAVRSYPKPKAKHGKMEKSFMSFKAAHPSWELSESSPDLNGGSQQQLQNQTDAALHREQELHIEAAARQLETLAELEEGRNGGDDGQEHFRAVDESYIPRGAQSNGSTHSHHRVA